MEKTTRQVKGNRKNQPNKEGYRVNLDSELKTRLLDETTDAIFICRPDGSIVYTNKIGCTLYGYSKEELISKHFYDLTAPEYACQFDSRIKDNIEQGKVIFESVHRRKDGSTIPVEIHAHLIEIGGEKCIVNSVRNISQLKIAEDKLHQSEAKYTTLVELSNDGILIIQNGLVQFANSRLFELTGFSPDEALGKRFVDFVPHEFRERLFDNYKKRLAGQVAQDNYEAEILTKNQQRVPVEINARRFEYEGKPIDMVVIQDITRKKKRDQEILMLSSAIEQSPSMVLLADSEGKVLYANPKFCKVTGHSIREILGEHVLRFAQPSSDDLGKIWRQITSGDEWHGEMLGTRNNGEQYWELASISPVRDLQGKIIHYLKVAEDITERKQSEDAIRQSKDKLRHMFEAVTDAILVTDLNGSINDVNERALSILGLSAKADILDKNAFDIIMPCVNVKTSLNVQKVLEQGAIKNLECTLTRADGAEFPAETSISVLKDSAGNPSGFIATIMDITERKRVDEQLILTDRLASVGELASGIAHELNNPLTSVIGFSQLLLERDLPEDISADIKTITSEAKRAAQVVKNLLTFARKHPLTKELLNVNDVIMKVLEIRAYEQKVNNITVVIQLAPDLPDTLADYFQLQQVFINIVINAEFFMIEAHKEGRLIISSERIGDFVRVSFTDDGPGISKENLNRIFAPFFTTKEVGKGTGLGLSICHGIITEHGGRIWAESEAGKGTTFIVELPITS